MATEHPLVSAGYEAAILGGLPGGGRPPFQFHRPGQPTHGEGVVVRVAPHDSSAWMGNFQRGDGALDGIYEAPSPDRLCVVAGGTGYWVAVRAPEQYEIVALYPIGTVYALPEAGILLFVSLTHLAAYGAEGLRWQTSRVSWDGIRILEASAQTIRGVAWDAPAEKEVGFFVDPRTGSHEGGASPPE
jgi:hypothetical protein